MTGLAGAIERLRSAVSEAASGGRATIGDAVDPAAFDNPEIATVPGEETIDHVTVRPTGTTRVKDLEAILGPGRHLPRNPSGGNRTVIFDDTLPGDGESGATVLAEVGEDGRVSRLIVRADAL